MRYPQLADELSALFKEDQRELREVSRTYYASDDPYTDLNLKKIRIGYRSSSKKRTDRLRKILELISEPTNSNIGIDGSTAVAVLGLHSSLADMEAILERFETALLRDPSDVYLQALPALIDRIQVLNNKKQIYGTQWLRGEDGAPFLYPVANFSKVNSRRKNYNLEPLRWPNIVDGAGSSLPKNYRKPAKSDQRLPTKRELKDYLFEFY